MKIMIFLFTLLFALTACGVDPMKKTVATTSTNAVVSVTSPAGVQCSCNALPMFVCDGISGKTYDNSCIAKCMGVTQTTQGHCQCDPNLMVCTSYGTENECDAIQFRHTIIQFAACGRQPL